MMAVEGNATASSQNLAGTQANAIDGPYFVA